MTYPDHISVYHKLRSAPNDSTNSLILDVLILSERHQRPAARCIEDLVIYDYKRGSKTPIRGYMVKAFRKAWELQEAAKIRNEQRIRALLESVTRLERNNWNREGAVEDTGSQQA